MSSFDLIVNVGSSLEQTFVYMFGGSPYDLTGWMAVLRLRDETDAVIREIRSTDAGDGTISITPSAGQLDASLAASATVAIVAVRGTFELELYTSGGRVFRLLDGSVSYRQRGRRSLDSRICVIQRTQSTETVEAPIVARVQRVDRGPPGIGGATGPEGPIIPVSNLVQGALPLLTTAYGRPVARADGTSVVHSRESVPVKAFDYLYADDQSRIQAAMTAAAALHCDVQFESRLYTGLSYLDLSFVQGVRLLGSGGQSFSSGGTTLEFTGAPSATVLASSSTVTVGTGSKTFTVTSGAPVNANYPVKAVSAAGTMYGTVASYAGISIVLDISGFTGSGSSSVWTITCTTKPLINLGSTNGCSMIGFNVRLAAAGIINRVIDSSWANLAAPTDTSSLRVENVLVIGVLDTLATHFYFGTTIGLIAEHCFSSGAYLGAFAGNGPSKFVGCQFSGFALRAMEVVSAEQSIDSCVFEPGTALGGLTSRLIEGIKCGPNNFGAANISNCVFNDSANNASGYWISAIGMRTVAIGPGNQIQSDAPQAVIYVSATERVGIFGANSFNGVTVAVEVDLAGSTVDTIYKSADNSWDRTKTFLTGGANVTDFIDESVNIVREGVTVDGPGERRNRAQYVKLFSSYGVHVAPAGVDMSTGVDLSFATNNIYNTYNGGAGLLKSLTVTGDGQVVEVTNTQAFPFTIVNNFGGAGAGYKPVITGTGADIVLPAASSTYPINLRLQYKSNFGAYFLVTPPTPQGVTHGSAVLTAGVSANISAVLTNNSSIIVSLKTPNTDVATVKYAALNANRANGTPGTFKISALAAAGGGVVNAADVSTVDWWVIN